MLATVNCTVWSFFGRALKLRAARRDKATSRAPQRDETALIWAAESITPDRSRGRAR